LSHFLLDIAAAWFSFCLALNARFRAIGAGAKAVMRRWALAIASTTGVMAAPLQAAGGGSAVPILVDRVTVEAGHMYLWSPQFANPDSCATAAVVVVTSNTPNWSAMYAMALTSITTNKKLSFWFNGCTPTNWYASAPVVMTMTIER
jgi:hypothetical protein